MWKILQIEAVKFEGSRQITQDYQEDWAKKYDIGEAKSKKEYKIKYGHIKDGLKKEFLVKDGNNLDIAKKVFVVKEVSIKNSKIKEQPKETSINGKKKFQDIKRPMKYGQKRCFA